MFGEFFASEGSKRGLKIMKTLIQFAIGCMVIIILEKCVSHPCAIVMEGEYKTAICSHLLQLGTIPDLPGDIQKLDLSGSLLDELNGDSFKPYANLVILKCEKIQMKKPITDKYLFKYLTNLEEVYFKSMNLTEASTFQWPDSIRKVHIIECLVQNINLGNAVHLRELDASKNDLQDIPVFNDMAPIHYVNLKENPLHGATEASLARACRVNHLDLSLIGNSDLKSITLFCTCKAILNWIVEFKIKSNVVKQPHSFHCSSNAENDTKCEKGPSPASLKLREDCLARSKQASALQKYLLVLTGLITLAILVFCVLSFLYGSLLRKKEAGDVVEIHQSDASPSPSPSPSPASSEERRVGEETSVSSSEDEPHLV